MKSPLSDNLGRAGCHCRANLLQALNIWNATSFTLLPLLCDGTSRSRIRLVAAKPKKALQLWESKPEWACWREEGVSAAGRQDGWQLQKEEYVHDRRVKKHRCGRWTRTRVVSDEDRVLTRQQAWSLMKGHQGGLVLCNTASDSVYNTSLSMAPVGCVPYLSYLGSGSLTCTFCMV